jgi:hypothetical protein
MRNTKKKPTNNLADWVLLLDRLITADRERTTTIETTAAQQYLMLGQLAKRVDELEARNSPEPEPPATPLAIEPERQPLVEPLIGSSGTQYGDYATRAGREYLRALGNPHFYNEFEGVLDAGKKHLRAIENVIVHNLERQKKASIEKLKREWDAKSPSCVPIGESEPRRKWWEFWK